MNQVAVIGLLLSCFGLAVCFSDGQDFPVILHPFSYNRLLNHASHPRAKRQINVNAILNCVGTVADVQCTSGLNLGLANTFAQWTERFSNGYCEPVCNE